MTQATIIGEVAKWSKEDQLNLIRAFLYQLGPDNPGIRETISRRPTLDEASGLLKSDKPVPSDEEIESLLY